LHLDSTTPYLTDRIFILSRASTQELCLLSSSTSKQQFWCWLPICFAFLY